MFFDTDWGEIFEGPAPQETPTVGDAASTADTTEQAISPPPRLSRPTENVAPTPPASLAVDDVKLQVLVLKRSAIFDDNLELLKVPHIGKGLRMTWPTFVEFLRSTVAQGDPSLPFDVAKRARGGWVGGEWADNHRLGTKFISTQLLTIDVDANGDIDRIAAAFAPYTKLIHSTYKSTPDKPRARLVLVLSEPCRDKAQYKAVHKFLRSKMVAAGWSATDLDDGASDCTRLNYFPMHQVGVEPRVLATDGALVDVARIVEATRLGKAPARKAPGQPPPTSSPRTGEAYRQGALRRAHEAMASATDGDRHALLFREAASLARPELGCSDEEIEQALLGPFLDVAGETRADEGARTIRDAIAAGRSGR
jgi:hypothetical protein